MIAYKRFYYLPLLGPGRKATMLDRLPTRSPDKTLAGKTRFRIEHTHRPVVLWGPAINGPLGAPVVLGEVFPSRLFLFRCFFSSGKAPAQPNPPCPGIMPRTRDHTVPQP
jgi:hypothetical protein